MSNVTSMLAPSHLTFPVHDIAVTYALYGGILGCPGGRSPPDWVDFNSYGYQIVIRLAPDEIGHRKTSTVDGDNVPVCHFGVVLSMPEQEAAADKLRAAGIESIIKPHTRFKSRVGEQVTMFFLDPSGSAAEIKAFANMASLFAK